MIFSETLGLGLLIMIVGMAAARTGTTLPLIPHHAQQTRRHLEDGGDAPIPRRRDSVAQQVGALYQGTYT
jgi:hypothetical protein